MIGFIKPKKLRKVRSYDEHGIMSGYEYFDEKTGRFRQPPYPFVETDSDVQVMIADSEWNDIIREDLRELEEQRDELIAKEAVIRAKLDRLLAERDAAPDSGRVSGKEIYDLQKSDEELRQSIEALDAKEKRAKKLIEERGWGSLTGTVDKNRHIRFSSDQMQTEVRDGETYYSIDFTEETGGIIGRLEARSVSDLREKVSIEDERFRIVQGVIPEIGRQGWTFLAAQRRISELSAAETRYLLELFDMAVFAGPLDRMAARKKIFEMLGLNSTLERMNKSELYREGNVIRGASDGTNDKWNMYTFSGYIEDYIAKKGISKAELAGRIGCNRSSLSGNINGSHQPSRKRAVKLAVALELSAEDMRRFISSAGYTFPCDNIDYKIIKLISEGGHTWYEILELLGVGEE